MAYFSVVITANVRACVLHSSAEATDEPDRNGRDVRHSSPKLELG